MAALAFDKEEKRRERARQREEAARVKERERRHGPSTRRKQPWKRPNGSMTRGPQPSTPSALPSKSNPKPRMCVGRRKRKNWKVLCAGRETRAPRAAAPGDGHG
jgi:hypothetical protein